MDDSHIEQHPSEEVKASSSFEPPPMELYDECYNRIRSKYFASKEVKQDYEEFMSNFNFIIEFLKLEKCTYTYKEYTDHIFDDKYEIFNRLGCFDRYGNKYPTYDPKVALLRNVLVTFERELDSIIRTYGCFGRICFNNRIGYKASFRKMIDSMKKSLFFNPHLSSQKIRLQYAEMCCLNASDSGSTDTAEKRTDIDVIDDPPKIFDTNSSYPDNNESDVKHLAKMVQCHNYLG